MPQTSIIALDKTNFHQLTKKIEQALKTGVAKAGDSGVEWIKEDVFNGQQFVGTNYFPDVKLATKKTKAKLGMEDVLVRTGNLRDSFDTHYSSDGLTCTIRGGGGNMNADYSRVLTRWLIDELFYKHRSKKSQEIIEKELKRVL